MQTKMVYRPFPSCPKNQEKKKGVFKFFFFQQLLETGISSSPICPSSLEEFCYCGVVIFIVIFFVFCKWLVRCLTGFYQPNRDDEICFTARLSAKSLIWKCLLLAYWLIQSGMTVWLHFHGKNADKSVEWPWHNPLKKITVCHSKYF